MKKSLKYTLIIIVSTIGIILIDTLQATVFNNSPLLKIRENVNGESTIYIDKGIFVNSYKCANNKKQTLSKNAKFTCPANNLKKDFTIIDEMTACDQALEEIYDDGYNKYYLNCIKSDKVYLKFTNGKTVKIKEALEKELVTITNIVDKNYSMIIKPKFDLKVSIKNNVTSKEKVNDYTIYYKNIKNANVEINDTLIPLHETLKNKIISRENLKTKLDHASRYGETLKEMYKDGGSTLYKGLSYNVLLCNTINGNKDIYIGDTNLIYEKGYCK